MVFLLAARFGGPFVTERGNNATQFAATVIWESKIERDKERKRESESESEISPSLQSLACCIRTAAALSATDPAAAVSALR